MTSTGYYDALVVSGSDMKSVTFTYESPATGEVKPFMGTPYCSPFQ